MAEYPTMPLRTDALIADTTHLSAAEFGGYVRVLVAMWRAGGTLPDDDARMMRFAGMTAREWSRSRAVIMAFLTPVEGGWTQKRLAKERLAVTAKCEQASHSAKARWLKEKALPDANASPPQCERNATHDPVSKETTSVVSEKRTREPRKVVPPADWWPDAGQVGYALSEGLPERAIEALAINFSQWHQSERKTRSPTDNFNATWQMWVRKEAERFKDKRNERPEYHPQQPRRPGGSGLFDAAARLGERFRAAGGNRDGEEGSAPGNAGSDRTARGPASLALLATG